MKRSLVHGQSYTLYARRGCRCDKCRAFQAARVAANRADRLTRLAVHGIRSSYDAGCRCEPCKAARREAGRLARERDAAGRAARATGTRRAA